MTRVHKIAHAAYETPDVDVVPALEFGLECKLAAQRVVSAALAPDADVRVGGHPLAKVKHSEVLKHFLDDRLVHQFDPIGVGSRGG